MSRYLEDSGFESARIHPLPPDPEARGPDLFAATARRPLASLAPDARPGTRYGTGAAHS